MTKLSDLSGQEMFSLRQEIKQEQSGDMTPERIIKVTLLDGSIVTMNTEERVISYQLAEQMIPLITDADSVFDDVLAALEESQEAKSTLRNMTIELSRELVEAQQTIARQEEMIQELQEVNEKWALDALFKEDDNS